MVGIPISDLLFFFLGTLVVSLNPASFSTSRWAAVKVCLRGYVRSCIAFSG